MNSIRTVGVVGLGLIGGSIAKGLKARLPGIRIIAFDNARESLEVGLASELIDEAADSLDVLTDGCDLICVCVPVQQIEKCMPALEGFKGWVTDVGSVKAPIVKTAERLWGELPANWVPGHPIAGSEQHSVHAADADLFVNHKVILTPLEITAPTAVKMVREFWNLLEAEVIVMGVAHHDDILAQTSHLPHLLAYTLVDVLAGFGDEREVFDYAAGGFRDFSRIAASDPQMWHDIFITNRGALLKLLQTFMGALQETADLIEEGDSEALLSRLERAKQARDYFSELQSKL
ncbi:MAG: prephenate dehydrogenase [Pseudomonadales bacterium]